jgi:hypothetical protein
VEGGGSVKTILRSWKVEVIADSSGQWATNGCRYATEEDARLSAIDLASRWYAVREWRVAPSEDEVNQEGPTIKGAGHRVKL